MPGGHEESARLTLAYDPEGSNFDATLRVFGAIHHDNDFAGGQQVRCIAPTVQPSNYGNIDPTGDCNMDQYMSKSGIPAALASTIPLARTDSYTDLSTVLGSLTVNFHPTDTLTLTSITGALHLNSKGWGEYSGTSIGQVWSGDAERTDTQSQEVRLISDFDGRLNFTLGTFYEHSFRYTFAPQLITHRGIDPATGKYDTSEREADNYSNSYSGFAQLRLKLLDNLELAGGARVTKEVKDTRIFTVYVAPGAVAAQAQVGRVIRLHYTDTNVSPEATLTWHPTSESTVYAAYKTGYKSGGFANPSTLSRLHQNNPSLLKLEAESAKGGEIGFKSYLFNRAVRFESAAYRYDFSNLQVSSYDVASASFQVRNAAKARTSGVEASINWHVTPQFSLLAAGGLNHARYLSFAGAPCYLGQTLAEGCVPTLQPNGTTVNAQNFQGRTLHRAPRTPLVFSGSYDVPVSDTLKLGVNADANYTSSYLAQENLAPASYQEAFWKFGAGVRVGAVDESWELALIGRNLANKYVITQGSDQPGGTKGTTTVVGPRPREVIVQGTVNF